MKKSVSRIDFFFFSCLVVFFSDVRVCEPLFLEIVSTGY